MSARGIVDKDKWINAERLRWATTFGVPMLSPPERMPPDFPANTLPIGRALCVLDSPDQSRLIKALDALFAAYWVDGTATHRPDELASLLRRLFGPAEADKSMFPLPQKSINIQVC